MLRCAWRLDFWAEIGNGASGATSGRPYCFPRCWASFFCWRPILKKPHKPAVGVFRMENLKRSRAGGFSLMSKSRKLAVSLQGGLWFALCVLLALSTPPAYSAAPATAKPPAQPATAPAVPAAGSAAPATTQPSTPVSGAAATVQVSAQGKKLLALIEPIQREIQGKFDDLNARIAAMEVDAKVTSLRDSISGLSDSMKDSFSGVDGKISELRDNLNKLGQDTRGNTKSIEELKAKLEETAIRVYEHLLKGMERSAQLDKLTTRLDELEALLSSRRPPPKAVESAGKSNDAKAKQTDDAKASGENKPEAEDSPKPASAAPVLRLPQQDFAPVGLLIATLLSYVAAVGFSLLESARLERWAVAPAGLRNLLVCTVTFLAYFSVGYWVMYGEFAATATTAYQDNGWREMFPLFQVGLAMVVGIAVATVLSDRLSMGAYLYLAAILAFLVYPLFGHWAWASRGLVLGKGWLESLGFADFAGATVVHSVAAWFALAWALRFPVTHEDDGAVDEKDGVSPAGNPVHASLAVFVLWLAWFGLVTGQQEDDTRQTVALIVNTSLAMAAAVLMAFVQELRSKRDDTGEGLSHRLAYGAVSGLVAVSAAANGVTALEAVVIGLVAGLLQPFASKWLVNRVVKHDRQAAGLIAVLGFSGIWGSLCVGLLGTEGNFALPNVAQTGIQALGVVAAFAFSLTSGLAAAYAWQWLSKLRKVKSEQPG